LVRARELVCQGASVRLASADYRVELEHSANAASVVDLRVVSDVLRVSQIDDCAQLKAKLGAQTQASDAASRYRLPSGKNVYYGIKIAALCVTPQESTKEWRVPRNGLERLIYRLWQMSPV